MNRHLRRRVLTAALLLAIPAPAALADWASGGGQIVKDATNPWFIQNTTTVRTCTIVDVDHFHTVDGSPEALQARIDEALAFWQDEFRNSWSVGNLVKVATQAFLPTTLVVKGAGALSARDSCPEDTDLTFQFGWLSTEQQRYFHEHMGPPNRFIAAAVRTDYDQVSLRGRGFIYIGADSGPLKIDGAGLVDRPWALGAGHLLTGALKHELGHVFGIPHKSMLTVMAADYLELTLSPMFAPYYAAEPDRQPFFKMRGNWVLREECPVQPTGGRFRAGWKRFLQIPDGHRCSQVELAGDRMHFRTGETLETLTDRGTLVFAGRETYMWDEAVRLYLPEDQTVISDDDIAAKPGVGLKPWLLGPMIKIMEHGGTYVGADGSTRREMLVTLSPQGIGFAASRFSVNIDGQWYWNLDWEY